MYRTHLDDQGRQIMTNYCKRCIPDLEAAKAENIKITTEFQKRIAAKQSWSDLPPLIDTIGTRIGIITHKSAWLSETIRRDTKLCNICGYEWQENAHGQNRGVWAGPCEVFPPLFEAKSCCVYNGTRRPFLGMLFKKYEDIPILHLLGRYDPEASREADRLLDESREKGIGFYHTDAMSLRDMALMATGG